MIPTPQRAEASWGALHKAHGRASATLLAMSKRLVTDDLREAPAGKDTERSEQMLNLEMVHRDFGSVEDTFATPAGGGRELSFLLAAQEARAALARAQEHAAIGAQDVLSQADEALVMG